MDKSRKGVRHQHPLPFPGHSGDSSPLGCFTVDLFFKKKGFVSFSQEIILGVGLFLKLQWHFLSKQQN